MRGISLSANRADFEAFESRVESAAEAQHEATYAYQSETGFECDECGEPAEIDDRIVGESGRWYCSTACGAETHDLDPEGWDER